MENSEFREWCLVRAVAIEAAAKNPADIPSAARVLYDFAHGGHVNADARRFALMQAATALSMGYPRPPKTEDMSETQAVVACAKHFLKFLCP